jgi:beta-glucosidase/6-phospho-beta-glucosidase/beta-galactosidase
LLLTATVDKRAGDREVDSKKKKRKEKKNARWIHSFIHST